MSWQAPGYAHRLELGGGKTGRAFLAADEETGELVVVKYLSVETTYVERVRNDLSGLSALSSERFVAVREVIEHDEGVAVVMEPINGAPLRTLLRDGGALPVEAALLVLHETLAGLAAAHAAGLAHGDYRPENIMIGVGGSPVMLDACAAGWIERDITLGTGVYLAPERWRAGAISAAADVYAATITFMEMVVGEPPYWEDSQLLALRYRHEQEEIPANALPAPLREIALLGMAKEVDARADADTLLAVVDVTAIAEYGPDWTNAGRAALVASVSAQQLMLGGVDVIEETPAPATGELVELDDYYATSETVEAEVVESGAAVPAIVESEAAGPEVVEVAAVEQVETVGDVETVAEAVAAAEVVAAAAEIVELARIEEMTAAGAYVSAEEDVLTAEEEQSVAEVEEIVAVVELDAVGVVTVEGTGIAATEAELVEYEQAEGVALAGAAGAVFSSGFAEGEYAEGGVAEGLIVGGSVVAGAAMTSEAVAGAAAGGVSGAGAAVTPGASGAGAGELAAGAAPIATPPAAAAAPPPRRRRSWLIAVAALLLLLLCGGSAVLYIYRSPGGPLPTTPQAGISETATPGGVGPLTSPTATATATSVASMIATPTGTTPAGAATSGTIAPSTPTSGSTATTPGVPGAGGASATPGASSTAPVTSGPTSAAANTTPLPTPKPSSTAPAKLPTTGAPTEYIIGLAMLLLAAGAALVIAARRRRV